MRRPMVEAIERAFVVLFLVLTAPLFVLIAAAIKLEGVVRPGSRGPVLFLEDRISRGEVFGLIKFRTLNRRALDALGPGPTHIKGLEADEQNLTATGRFLKRFYLDELPQLINIVKGEMTLVGTRPWPIAIYEAELASGITRKRDMPAGMLGPVQAAKGDETSPSGIALDLAYFESFKDLPWHRLLATDARIVMRCIRVMLEGKSL